VIDDDALNGYGLFQAKIAPTNHTLQVVNASDAFTQLDMFVAFP
jgi:hypothetical protein